MRTGLTRTIGVLGNGASSFRFWESHTFTSVMMQSLITEAAKHGYHITLLTGLEQSQGAEDILPDVGMVDGLLVLNKDLSGNPYLPAFLSTLQKPVTYVLDYPSRSVNNAFAPDDEQGAFLATQMLVDEGHKRIAFARKDYFREIFDRREKGYTKALSLLLENSIPPTSINIDKENLESITENSVTAVICANNHIADHIIAWADMHDVTVPDDLSIVSMEHQYPQQDNITPDNDISAVLFPLQEIVSRAVSFTIEQISVRRKNRCVGGKLEHTASGQKRPYLFPYFVRLGNSVAKR
jgi:LacI family transcriptional regulator